MVKSVYIIETKYKTKYIKYVALNKIAVDTNFVSFKGVEINDDKDLLDYKTIDNKIKESIENNNYIERYIPWVLILQIQLKRYKEE